MKIVIISDIHEDYSSLKIAARIIEQKKCDMIICLGDIVGFSVPYYDYLYSRNASKCIQWVKSNCKYVLSGNHDLYAVKKTPISKVREFVFPQNWYQLSFHERIMFSKNNIWLYEDNELSALISDEEKDYLYHLPEYMCVEIDNRKCLLSHFIYPDLSGSYKMFLFDIKGLTNHLDYMAENNCTLGFSGHMHYEGFSKLLGDDLIKIGFGKKTYLNTFDWVSVPAISNSKNNNGFIIWDTQKKFIEPISLRKKFTII